MIKRLKSWLESSCSEISRPAFEHPSSLLKRPILDSTRSWGNTDILALYVVGGDHQAMITISNKWLGMLLIESKMKLEECVLIIYCNEKIGANLS